MISLDGRNYSPQAFITVSAAEAFLLSSVLQLIFVMKNWLIEKLAHEKLAHLTIQKNHERILVITAVQNNLK
jgi:hypothetical protein